MQISGPNINVKNLSAATQDYMQKNYSWHIIKVFFSFLFLLDALPTRRKNNELSLYNTNEFWLKMCYF